MDIPIQVHIRTKGESSLVKAQVEKENFDYPTTVLSETLKAAQDTSSVSNAPPLFGSSFLLEASSTCFFVTITKKKRDVLDKWYCLRIESNGQVQFEIDLPGSASTDTKKLDALIKGALQAISPAPASSPVKIPVKLSFLEHQVVQKKIHLIQPQVIKQWHPGLCGYHSLYNAKKLLDVAANIMSSTSKNGKVEMDWDDIPSGDDVLNETIFWTQIVKWMNICSNKFKNSTANIKGGILDEIHMQFLIDSDPCLTNRTTIIMSDTTHLDPKNVADLIRQSNVGKDVRSHAFVLGCRSHWISAVVGCSDDHSKSCLLVSDSHNKPYFDFIDSKNRKYVVKPSPAREFETPRDLALHLIEKYRHSWIENMQRLEQYEHWPLEKMNELFDSGIVEYWKGVEKNRLWWNSKPADLRVQLMTLEIEAAVDLINLLLKAAEIMVEHPWEADTTWLLRNERNEDNVCITNLLDDVTKQTDDDENEKLKNAIDKNSARTAYNPDVTNLKEFKGYVRREEYLDKDSALYKAGNSIENRKKAPPKEIPGDPFDRQRVVVGFDQTLIERQKCLVVGTGGIGMDTAFGLARLGVEHITLLDYDIVEASNLTRQCCAGISDIGSAKVDAARRILTTHHSIRTKVTALNIDVVKHWDTVVALAKESSVIFNCVDVGSMYDICLNSLSKELQIPLVAGQSLGWKFMTEIYSGNPQEVCAFCEDQSRPAFGLSSNHDVIINRLLEAASKKAELSLNTTSMLSLLSEDPQFRIYPDFEETRKIITEVIDEMTCKRTSQSSTKRYRKLPINRDNVVDFLESYHKLAMEKLMPGKITKLKSVGFLPRPMVTATRFVGSWVGPCMGCATMMVSNYANFLTGPTGRNCPTNMVFNLDDGMTGVEKMAYELSQFQMTVDKSDRSFTSTLSNINCSVCKAACLLSKSTKNLYFGDEKVFLKPTGGNACGLPSWMPSISLSSENREKLENAARARYKPHKLSDGSVVVAPVMPVSDLPLTGINSIDSRFFPSDISTLPLLKCSKNEAERWPSALEGVASGKRSAVVFIKGKSYRLKGCGNLEQGFPIEKHGDHGELMVRGCMFDHTVQRELYMSALVDTALKNHGFKYIRCANKPIGFYKYTEEFDQDTLLGNPYCGIFETLGDRRLGDHLLAGIENLLPLLYHDTIETLKPEWIQDMKTDFEEKRGNLWDTATRAECGMDAVNLSDMAIKESVPFYSSDQRTKRVVDIPTEYSSLWDLTCDDFSQSLNKLSSRESIQSVLLWLAERIGEECGHVCRAMKHSNISWGTYPDAMGIHCNAHANNMVVRSNRSNFESFLCPLDFDMAFEKSTFLKDIVEKQHQKIFPSDFDELLKWEHQLGFRTSIAGSNFTSTGVSNETASATNDDETRLKGYGDFMLLLRIAFRDTMVKTFDAALNGKPKSKDNQGYGECADAVIKLALISTSRVVC